MKFSSSGSNPGADAAGSGAHGPLSDVAARIAEGFAKNNKTIAVIILFILPHKMFASRDFNGSLEALGV
jgi:hypothetical protein